MTSMYFAKRSELRVTTSPMKLGSLITYLCQSGLVFMKHVQVLKFLSHCQDKSFFIPAAVNEHLPISVRTGDNSSH